MSINKGDVLLPKQREIEIVARNEKKRSGKNQAKQGEWNCGQKGFTIHHASLAADLGQFCQIFNFFDPVSQLARTSR